MENPSDIKSNIQQPKSKYDVELLEKKCTHLYLQDKYLKKIPKFASSKHLLVLYLYNNQINHIQKFPFFPNLHSLYLQNNAIEVIENLENLKNLKKLFLGHNSISVLEGLEVLEKLEELHIEKQLLPDNINLCVDPRTISALGETLQVLDISHDKIANFSYLMPLKNLVFINAAYNDLDDLREVCQTIRNWLYLKSAIFKGNGFTKKHRYREDVIASTYRLEMLDDKPITEVTRCFIKRFEEEKLVKGSKHSINLADIISGIPSHHPLPIQKAISASILKSPRSRLLENDLSTFDEKDAVYISWNALPKAKPLVRSKRTKTKNTKKPKAIITTFPSTAHNYH